MRELEAEIGCPKCRTLYAQVFRVEMREGIFRNVTEPEHPPVRCTRCETILERTRK